MSKMTSILALSHTDVKYDSRIIKSAKTIVDAYPDLTYYLVGISRLSVNEGACLLSDRLFANNIYPKSLRLPKIFRIIRSILAFLELNFLFFMQCFKVRPSLIHCHDLSGVYAALIYKQFAKCVLILDAHELESSRNGLSPLMHVVTTVFEYPIVKLFDSVIAVSDSIALWYKWKGAKNVITIVNAPLLSPTNSAKPSLLEALPPRNKLGVNLIYIGILCPGRGIEDILKTFINSENFNIYFLGEGPLQDFIQQLIDETTNIYWHPYVNSDRVADFIKDFDYSLCLVEPVSLSDYFCLPNKLFESLAAGVPVIASSLPELSSLLGSSKHGILVKDLRDVLTMENLKTLSLNIKSRLVVDNHIYTWCHESEKIKHLYRQYISN